MQKKYIVDSSNEERVLLNEVVKKLEGSSQKAKLARILLEADVNGPSWTDARIAEACDCRTKTVDNVRQRFVEHGFDWATEMAKLLEGRYAECEKVILVCDNLNTHTKGAFYETFEPERARTLVRKLEFHYTPRHGSWLNMAENELSSMTRQCVSGRRIGCIEDLRKETAAWYCDVNHTKRGIEWPMQIDDARVKLKSVYPKIKK